MSNSIQKTIPEATPSKEVEDADSEEYEDEEGSDEDYQSSKDLVDYEGDIVVDSDPEESPEAQTKVTKNDSLDGQPAYISRQVKRIEELVPANLILSEKLTAKHSLSKNHYVDNTFSKNTNEQTTLTTTLKLPKIEWSQIQWRWLRELPDLNQRAIFTNISPTDISVGSVTSPRYLAAIAALAERPELIARLFDHDKLTQDGIIAVWVNVSGFWRQVTVDECFPMKQNVLQFIFASNKSKNLWVSYLEKAYAKAFGSYQAILSSLEIDTLRDLTGAPCEIYNNKDELKNAQILQRRLARWTQRGFVITCRCVELTSGPITTLNKNEGIFTIVKVIKDVKGSDGKSYTLVQLRNIIEKVNWSGNFSESSNLWTEESKRLLKPGDGLFWMTLEDLSKKLTSISICKVHDKYLANSTRFLVDTEGKQNTHKALVLEIERTGRYYLSIDQEDHRKFGNKGQYSPYGIRLTLLKAETGGLIFVGSKYAEWRCANLKCKLTAGRYLVLVEACTNQKQVTKKNFTFTSYGRYRAGVEFMSTLSEDDCRAAEYYGFADCARFKRGKWRKKKAVSILSEGPDNEAQIHQYKGLRPYEGDIEFMKCEARWIKGQLMCTISVEDTPLLTYQIIDYGIAVTKETPGCNYDLSLSFDTNEGLNIHAEKNKEIANRVLETIVFNKYSDFSTTSKKQIPNTEDQISKPYELQQGNLQQSIGPFSLAASAEPTLDGANSTARTSNFAALHGLSLDTERLSLQPFDQARMSNFEHYRESLTPYLSNNVSKVDSDANEMNEGRKSVLKLKKKLYLRKPSVYKPLMKSPTLSPVGAEHRKLSYNEKSSNSKEVTSSPVVLPYKKMIYKDDQSDLSENTPHKRFSNQQSNAIPPTDHIRSVSPVRSHSVPGPNQALPQAPPQGPTIAVVPEVKNDQNWQLIPLQLYFNPSINQYLIVGQNPKDSFPSLYFNANGQNVPPPPISNPALFIQQLPTPPQQVEKNLIQNVQIQMQQQQIMQPTGLIHQNHTIQMYGPQVGPQQPAFQQPQQLQPVQQMQEVQTQPVQLQMQNQLHQVQVQSPPQQVQIQIQPQPQQQQQIQIQSQEQFPSQPFNTIQVQQQPLQQMQPAQQIQQPLQQIELRQQPPQMLQPHQPQQSLQPVQHIQQLQSFVPMQPMHATPFQYKPIQAQSLQPVQLQQPLQQPFHQSVLIQPGQMVPVGAFGQNTRSSSLNRTRVVQAPISAPNSARPSVLQLYRN